MPSKTLSAQIETPMSDTDSADVKVETIPLPPIEMWGELENGGPAPTPAGNAPAAAEPPAAVVVIDELDFVGDVHKRLVPLKHPFRLGGKVVSEIPVRRLKIGEIDKILRDATGASLQLFDIYSMMSGYPASVLRGLIDEDGDAVTEVAYDFLPRALRPAEE